MADGYILSESDVEKLRTLWRERESRERTPTKNEEEEFLGLSTEFYVAKTPVGGIPARVGTYPGSAVCDIYSVEENPDPSANESEWYYLSQVDGTSQRIINISAESIEGEEWVRVAKDKYGQWHALTGGGGTSVLVARCTGRSAEGLYPGILVTQDDEGDWVDGTACLLETIEDHVILPQSRYHCVPDRTEDGLTVYKVISPIERLVAQLVNISVSGSCPTYTCLRVEDWGDCSTGVLAQGLTGPALTNVRHLRDYVLPTYPPPSPLVSSPAVAESDSSVGGIPWSSPKRVLGDSDGTYTTVTLSPGETSERLKLTDLGFVIPEQVNVDGANTDVTITQINWTVTMAASGGGVTPTEVALIVYGNVLGSSFDGGGDLDTEDEGRQFEGGMASWTGGTGTGTGVGDELEPVEANSDDYGLSLRFTNNAGLGTGTPLEPGDDGIRTVRVGYANNTLTFEPEGEYVASMVHQLYPREAGELTFDSEPRMSPVKPVVGGTPITVGGVTYHPSTQRIWNQSTKTFQDGESVYIIYVE